MTLATEQPTDVTPEEELDRNAVEAIADDITDMALALHTRKNISISDAIRVIGTAFSLVLIPQPGPFEVFELPPTGEAGTGDGSEIPDNVIPFPVAQQPQEAI